MLMRPSPLPHAASTSNPTPSSENVSARPSDAAAEMDAHGSGPAVLHRVLQGLLHDAEERQGQIERARFAGTRSCVNVIVGPDRDSSRWSAWSAATSPISRSLRRMQTVREVVDAPGNLLRPVQRLAGERFAVGRNRAAEQLEIDREQGDLLADVVVQFAGDAGTFGVLGMQQPRRRGRECASNCSAAPLRCRAIDPRPPAPPSLHEQAGDEEPLRQQHRRGAQDVDPESLPAPTLAWEPPRGSRAPLPGYPGIALGQPGRAGQLRSAAAHLRRAAPKVKGMSCTSLLPTDLARTAHCRLPASAVAVTTMNQSWI